MNWFYESGGKQNGPVSDEELDALLAQGIVTQDTLAWHEGLADWQPLRQARPAPLGADALVRCASCGLPKPAGEIVQIGQRPICAACKPAVLLGLQQGSSVLDLSEIERAGPPWEHREQLGFFPAMFETVKGVLTLPNETFGSMKREGGIGSPALFYVCIGVAGTIVGTLLQLLFMQFFRMPIGQPAPGMEGFQTWANYLVTPLGMLIHVITSPLLIFVSSFIYAGVFHVCLMICGGAKKPFETTYRVLCYTGGSALVLSMVPYCGAIIAFFWGAICFVIGLGRAHEVHVGRAVCAVILPLFVCCAGLMIIGMSIGFAGAAQHH